VKFKHIFPILLSTFLFGCNAANVQPQPADEVAQELPAPQPAPTQDDEVRAVVEQMTNRLTAVQEQLLNVRSQSARQLEQLQSLQVQLATLSQELRRGPVQQTGSNGGDNAGQPSSEEFALLLDQMAQTANEISLQMQDGSYRFASCYTASGQWILIRYDRYTGESWLADGGIWMALDDGGALNGSIYEVKLERADKDVKGFVAARLDRQTGQVWWLKQNSWQLLEQ